MVFQDASSSLNPLMTIGEHVAESIMAGGRAAPDAEVVGLLRDVGLPDPELRRHFYPHQLSGGQRQRAMIAIAIANKPNLLIADEPTTALDVTIQAQILSLFKSMRRLVPGMGMIFITHDLGVVSAIADRVIVMYAGEVVETGPVETILSAPRHPYTRALIASSPENAGLRLSAIPGSVVPPSERPQGCAFAERCRYARTDCGQAQPQLLAEGDQGEVRCHHWRAAA